MRFEPALAESFLNEFREVMSEISISELRAVVQVLQSACADGRYVFVMGNGGSAALASHLACDLNLVEVDGLRFRVSCLCDSGPLLSALSNDLGFGQVFREQLAGRLQPGDVSIGISASGDSENVVQAAAYARERGGVTVGLVGSGGGRLGPLLDHAVCLSCRDVKMVESVMGLVTHVIVRQFRRMSSG